MTVIGLNPTAAKTFQHLDRECLNVGVEIWTGGMKYTRPVLLIDLSLSQPVTGRVFYGQAYMTCPIDA